MSNTRKVNPLEQHIEKLAVLIAIGVLGWVAYSYWFTSPYTIEMSGATVSPGEIDKKLLEEAKKLDVELTSPTLPPLLERVKIPPYKQQFATDLNKKVVQNVTFAQTGVRPFLEPSQIVIDEGDDRFAKREYHVPVVPAPTMYAVRSNLNTLLEAELQNRPGLDKLVPVGQFDLPITSIRAQFDAKTMLEELMKDPEDPKIHPVPVRNWNDMFWVVDVQVERQMLKDDGTWTDAETLSPLPGQHSFRSKLGTGAKMTNQDLQMLLQELGEHQPEVIQPTPLSTVVAWSPPEPVVEDAAAAGDQMGLSEIERQLKLKNIQLQNLQKQMDRLNRAGGARTSSPSGGRGSFGPEEGLDGPGGRGAIGGTSGGAASGKARQMQRLQERIQGISDEIRALQTQYQQKTGTLPAGSTPAPGRFPEEGFEEGFEPGFDPTGRGGFNPRAPVAPRGFDPGFEDPELLGEGFAPGEPGAAARQYVMGANVFSFGKEVIDLFAFDLTAKTGRTYRYRTRVFVYNPLFKQPMVEKQEKVLKDNLTLSSDWSDWSDAVTIERMEHYFLVNGGNGNARMEVWKYTDGKWHNFEFTVSPGDPVGWPIVPRGAPAGAPSIDFSTGAMLVDVEKITIPGKIAGLNRQSTRVLIANDGQIAGIMVEDHRDHPKRKKLQNLKAMQDAKISAVTR